MAVAPSPKFHVQAAGEPVEVSVNRTVSGATPDVGAAVNAATGFKDGCCAPVCAIPTLVKATVRTQTATSTKQAAAARDTLRLTTYFSIPRGAGVPRPTRPDYFTTTTNPPCRAIAVRGHPIWAATYVTFRSIR